MHLAFRLSLLSLPSHSSVKSAALIPHLYIIVWSVPTHGTHLDSREAGEDGKLACWSNFVEFKNRGNAAKAVGANLGLASH